MSNQDNNKHPLDEWDDQAKKSQADFVKQCLLDTSLVFGVFSTPQGEKLLERWKELLIYQPTVYPGKEDLISIGMAEGQKNFIRSILMAKQTHEGDQ